MERRHQGLLLSISHRIHGVPQAKLLHHRCTMRRQTNLGGHEQFMHAWKILRSKNKPRARITFDNKHCNCASRLLCEGRAPPSDNETRTRELPVWESLEIEYIIMERRHLPQRLHWTDALKYAVKFCCARTSKDPSFPLASHGIWSLRNKSPNWSQWPRTIDQSWVLIGKYLWNDLGHSIFGFSTWAIRRLIVIAIDGW